MCARKLLILVCWGLLAPWALAGCDEDGSGASADGQATDGQATDGQATDGQATDGQATDGQATDANPIVDAGRPVDEGVARDLAPTPDLGPMDEGPSDQGVFDQGADAVLPPPEVPEARAEGTAATVEIGPLGGIVAVTEAGRSYTLTVPPGALAEIAEITLTPAVVSGLADTVERFTAGVILEPSGLQFAVPAELAITGAEVGVLAMGLVFDDVGGVTWQHPEGDAERLTLSIAHFSGAALADIAPGAWGTVLELTGELPFFEIEEIAAVSLRDVPERVLCFAATTQSGRAMPRVPVEFELRSGLGGLADADNRTNAVGNACVRWRGIGTPNPEGTTVVIAATAFKNAGFEGTVFSRFRWGGDVPEVRLTGLDSEQTLEAGSRHRLCAEVSFEGISPPLEGYPVRLSSSRPELIAFDSQFSTDAAGLYCAEAVVAADYDLGDASPFVDLLAEVPLDADRVGAGLLTVQVADPRLSVRFDGSVPGRLLAGSPSTRPCVLVLRGEGPAEALAVTFTLAGVGVLSERVVVTDAQGRACTGYTPPAEAPGVVEVLGASVTEGERTAQASLAITVDEPMGDQAYAGTWTYSNVQTETDGSGMTVASGTYTLGYSAEFRVVRHADGTWTGDSISGGGTASRGRACFLEETDVITGFGDIHSEINQGVERVTINYVSDYTAAVDFVCELAETRSVSSFVFADREPDGRFLRDESDAGSDTQVSPDDGRVTSSTSYSFAERVELVPVD